MAVLACVLPGNAQTPHPNLKVKVPAGGIQNYQQYLKLRAEALGLVPVEPEDAGGPAMGPSSSMAPNTAPAGLAPIHGVECHKPRQAQACQCGRARTHCKPCLLGGVVMPSAWCGMAGQKQSRMWQGV